MKGHWIRGILAGILLGIVLDLDLFFGGVVQSNSSTLTILPIVCVIAGFLLGLWAPIGRYGRNKKPQQQQPVRPVTTTPLPAPVAWPEGAPVEGSTLPSPGSWNAPPPPPPPGDSAPPAPSPQENAPPPSPPPAPPI